MLAAAYRKTALAIVIALLASVVPRASTEQTKPEDKKKEVTPSWPMLGGTPNRNMVNLNAGGISHIFPKGGEDGRTPVPGTRIKWKTALGSQSFASPVIAGGKILIGTNNEQPRNPRDRGKPTDDEPNGSPLDKGILMCFDQKTGTFLWQMVHDMLESGQVNDWPREGVCSTPIVDGERVYYVSNRCEVVCLDLNGFANGNEGFNKERYQSKIDGDVIWSFDMMRELKVFPHNKAISSPLILGDLLYVGTGNGVDENHINLPFPAAPSFLCLNKKTGKLVWKQNVLGKIMHGHWSSPAAGVIGGKPRVVFPGGDGWLYAYEPETGKPLWRFDANPKDSEYELGGKGTRSDFIGTPVIYKERVYIGTGQDPEHFTGIGHFWCIDPAGKEGDISPDLVTDETRKPPATKQNPNNGSVWHYGGDDQRLTKRDFVFGRTMSTACIVDDVVYISEIDGYVHCLDAQTGKKFWQWDTKSAIWGSCYYVDGKVILANEDGDVHFFKHEKTQAVLDEVADGWKAACEAEKLAQAAHKSDVDVRKAARDAYDLATLATRKKVRSKFHLQQVEFGESSRSTPIVVGDTLYLATGKNLYALTGK